MNLKVDISRRYYCDDKTLFAALAEGYLFFYTGAIKERTSIDFKVGGKIHIEWREDLGGGSMDGQFTEIIPSSRISFTWITDSSGPTSVTVTIAKQAEYCELRLVHDGFKPDADVWHYDFGWDDALLDLKKHVYRETQKK